MTTAPGSPEHRKTSIAIRPTVAVPSVHTALRKFTKKHYVAASLLAEDDLSDEQIAEQVGVTRQTLANWKKTPDFAALVGDYTGQIQAAMLKLSIARKHKRLAVLDDLHSKALAVIEQRGARYASELAEFESAVVATRRLFGTDTPAEAATGLLVKQETANNSGVKTVNWAFDGALVKEVRALHEQAAKELGQWEEKQSINHGGMIRTIVLEDD